MRILLLLTLTTLTTLTSVAAVAAEPYFSEYIEGTSNNKAIEIANPGPGALDLSGYRLELYFNGSTTASINHVPGVSLPAGQVYVFAHASANPAILAVANATSGTGLWNGDDALVLRRIADGVVIDSIGQVGVDPGTAWGSGAVSTIDHTLRRVAHPDYDSDPSDAFAPAPAWAGFPVDTFDDIGVPPSGGGVPSLSVNGPSSLLEAVGSFTVTISRTTADSAAIISVITTTGSSIVGGSLTLATGERSGSVVLNVQDDAVQEADEVVTLTVSATGYQDATLLITVADDDISTVAIHDIQGAAHTSPLSGLVVLVADAIVTARDGRGFWMQEPDDQIDGEVATSEGIYVFLNHAPTVAVGDLVSVRGRVVEFFPDGVAGDGLSVTELSSSPIVTVLASSQTLPTPVVIGVAGRLPPTTTIDDDGLTSFDPANDGADFYESLAGMLVAVDDAVVVGPTNSFGEIWLLPDGGVGATSRSEHGGALVTANDTNPERVQIDDYLVAGAPQANVGDHFPGRIVGIMHYKLDNYRVYQTQALPTLVSGGLVPEITSLPEQRIYAPLHILRMATINLENLYPSDPRIGDHARAIVERLDAPAILALEEVQDASGPTNDGTTDGTVTGAALIAAISALGGPTYQYIEIAPQDGQDGGQPGGNIRQAFLYRAPVTLKPGPIGDAVTPIQVQAGGTLSLSLGRIDPTNPAFTTSRKPLVAVFQAFGRDLVVIANHWNSKGGDQPLYSRVQPPVLISGIKRLTQAEVVAGFIDQLLDRDPQALVAVLGDLNDYTWSPPVQRLLAVGMHDLDEFLAPAARYSYVFQGNSQTLDHLLASPALRAVMPALDVVHYNSEFAQQISDHDPGVTRLTIIPRLPRWLANLLWPRPLDANG